MPCGADWQSGGATWQVGGQFEFSTYENAHSFQDLVSTELGGRASGPYTSTATKESVQADCLADAVAGYK